MKKIFICMLFMLVFMTSCTINENAVFNAISKDRVEYIESYYTQNPTTINYQTSRGYVLNVACSTDASIEMIKKLVELGADVNVYDRKSKCTPLSGIYKNNRDDVDDVALYLLSVGAGVDELSQVEYADYDLDNARLIIGTYATFTRVKLEYYFSYDILLEIMSDKNLNNQVRFNTIVISGFIKKILELKNMENYNEVLSKEAIKNLPEFMILFIGLSIFEFDPQYVKDERIKEYIIGINELKDDIKKTN